MTTETCNTCMFFEKPLHQDSLAEEDREGRCRRFPATHIGHDKEEVGLACQEASHWAQPVMFSCDWCGEYKQTLSALTPTEPSKEQQNG